MSNHVFVSHSHQDAPGAELIVEALEKRGVTCWMAPRDVPPGGSYAEAILNAIESASCFVLVYSQHSNVSSHVLREVERALKFDLNIVPVRFDDSAPSKSLDYLLATVHWLAIAPDSRDRSIDKAAEQIAAWMAKAQSTPPAAEPARIPSSQPITPAVVAPRPKRSLVWITVLLVVVASLIYWLVSKNSTPARKAEKNEVAANAPASSPSTATATISPEANQLPVAVTHRYFTLLTKRNATAAYNLLSEEYRRHLAIARFSRTVGSKPAVKLVEVTQASKTDRTASVAVVFEDTDPATNQARWKGNVDFVLESGAWRIDGMKGLYPASGRPISDSASGADDETAKNVSQPTPAPTPTPPPTPPATPTPIPSSSLVPSPTPAPQKMRGIVNGPNGGATLHEQPLARTKVVTPLKNGDRLEIDRIEGDWLHATTDDKKSGFVHKSKVRINP
jgi:TIR domain-containing protein